KVNASDLGIPQHRKRLILIATRTGDPIEYPEKVEPRGWYSALEDIYHKLEARSLPNWLGKLVEPTDTDILIDSKRNIRWHG
ncbi:DNA cytosine methyltransferase, partial [Methylobacterium crusticola]|uniref:DNA cytosine methyltransferase n=1 Tax=Methylobacterium crusticola TaxID=1697972 RepID=UPI001EE2FB68